MSMIEQTTINATLYDAHAETTSRKVLTVAPNPNPCFRRLVAISVDGLERYAIEVEGHELIEALRKAMGEYEP